MRVETIDNIVRILDRVVVIARLIASVIAGIMVGYILRYEGYSSYWIWIGCIEGVIVCNIIMLTMEDWLKELG